MLAQAAIAAAVLLVLAGSLGLLLTIASRRLAVAVDPLEGALMALLPGANCGGCGFPGCRAYARALAGHEVPPDRCTVGGPAVGRRLAARLGTGAVTPAWPRRPVVHCGAVTAQRRGRGRYLGPATCAEMDAVAGVQGCSWGCLGEGDCVAACAYGAMRLEEGLPRIDYDRCVGCGACVQACPREVIESIPWKRDRMLVVACRNHDPGRSVRDVCDVGCLGCGRCSRALPELFRIEGDLAVIDYDRYEAEDDIEEAAALDRIREQCPMKSLVLLGPPPASVAEPDDGEPHEAAVVRAPPRPDVDDLDWRG